jgi:Tfp pilus assembly PilM family ATPase
MFRGWSWTRRRWSIGCEIGAREVRLVQIQERGDALDLVAEARQLPPGGDLDANEQAAVVAGLVRSMLQTGRYEGSRVVSSLPATDLLCRAIRLAPMPHEELAQATHWKLASELAIKPDRLKSAILTHDRVTESEKPRIEVVAVGAPVDVLERHATMLVDAGLNPQSIDCTAGAMVRGLAFVSDDAASARLVLHVDERSSAIAVAEDGQPRFYRPIAQGLDHFDKALARLLEIPLAQAQAIRLALRNGTTDEWPVPSIPSDRARAAATDAARMFGRELGREVALALLYFQDALGGTAPQDGILLGEPIGADATTALEVQSGASFEPVRQLTRPGWAEALGPVDPDAGWGSWMTSIGLSLYARPDAQHKQRAA